MNHKMIAAGLGALTLLGAGIAVAQPAAIGPGRGGEISRADLVQKLDQRFARLDVNKDGNLSPADRSAGVEARFKQLDSDGNGALSLAEFTAAHGKRDAAFAARGGDGEHGLGRHRGGRGGNHRGGFGRSGGTVDVNGDGAVSKAEFQSAALAAFDKADANRDGKLTAAERQAARAARRAQPAA